MHGELKTLLIDEEHLLLAGRDAAAVGGAFSVDLG